MANQSNEQLSQRSQLARKCALAALAAIRRGATLSRAAREKRRHAANCQALCQRGARARGE